MSARKGERIGRPEFVRFQEADGRMTSRLLYPILDEFGGWIRYTDDAGARAHLEARGIK